jgi:lysozyme family protein
MAHTLLYMHCKKLNFEVVGIWEATQRAVTLQGCCNTKIYRITPDNQIHVYVDNYWSARLPKDMPEEIKLAAMLV